ncbi:MAG TPA: hypothetical protein VG323_07080 [Thermoanaerobaculia bacterium]|nr:hypothetical protein [Thermoanaerobaculia bacterium]
MWIFASAFSAWALISILAQFNLHSIRRLKSVDVFGLIPNWRFFANPVDHDSYLYYRDHSTAGVTPWRRAFNSDDRHWYDSLWGPLRREEGAIYSSTLYLLAEAEALDAERLQQCAPYLNVLSYVVSLPRSDSAAARQFLLAYQMPGCRPRPVFLSNIHPLPDDGSHA